MVKSVKMHGLKDVVLALRRLPSEISGAKGGPLRGALFAATRLIRDAARQNAPIGRGTPAPGNLKRAIYAYRNRNPKRYGANEIYEIGVRGRGPRLRNSRRESIGQATARNVVNVIAGNAYYWRFVEFGTVKQPPQSFMRRAFEENKVRAVNVFEQELLQGVAKAVARLRRTKGRP